MNILVNGKTDQVDDGFTLSAYLIQKKLEPESVVVELNGAVILKENYETCVIKDNDCLEIVRFVGGG